MLILLQNVKTLGRKEELSEDVRLMDVTKSLMLRMSIGVMKEIARAVGLVAMHQRYV